jgi:hypothetical protein
LLRLGAVEHPRHYLLIFEQLLKLPLKEVEQIAQALTSHKENGAR